MALNFPNNPTVDQEYTLGTRTWRWDGNKWNLINSGIKGKDGQDGLTAYEIAVNQGFQGTEQDFIDFLKGDDAPVPEFRTFYPPPVIEDPTLSTSVTDSDYTTNFNQATQQPGVFQWKYTNEDDSAWRDQYPVSALTDPLEYFLVEFTVEDLTQEEIDDIIDQLTDPVLIQQLNPVASGTNVSELSGVGYSEEEKYINVYVRDAAGNVALYNFKNIVLEETPGVESIQIQQSSFSVYQGDDNTSGQLTADVTADEGVDDSVTWSSSNEGLITIDNNGNWNLVEQGTTGIFTAIIEAETVEPTSGGSTLTDSINIEVIVTEDNVAQQSTINEFETA